MYFRKESILKSESHINILEPEEADKVLNPAEVTSHGRKQSRGWRLRDGGWVQVKAVMDSGCAESVAPPDLCPEYALEPSAGSIRGQNFISASKDRIPNLGQKKFEVETEDGSKGKIKYQIADVSRPLNAISDICDAGNRVIFGKNGGMIMNIESGTETYFNRENGIYVLNLWIKPKEPNKDSDFRGQGRR